MSETLTASLLASTLIFGMYLAGNSLKQQFLPLHEVRERAIQRLKQPPHPGRPPEPSGIVVLGTHPEAWH